jgi:branched-chain amino acid transport system ATP-binding protein
MASTDGSGVLVAEGLRKSFGGLVVLDDVSLSVPRGGRLGVIGPNGSGKTTLLNMLSGFVRGRGRVRLSGDDVTRASPTRRARAGMARTFQVAAVVEEWTVFENIALAAAVRRQLGWRAFEPLRQNSALRADALESSERWGLRDYLQVPIRALPYGIVRRTELAMGTIGNPHVLLLDEPAAGLSTDDGRRIVATIRELFPDAAMVLVEHDMDVVFDFCEALLVLDRGRVVAAGDPRSVRADPAVKAAYLGGAV